MFDLEKETRQRFQWLRDDGWTLEQISVETGLNVHWLNSYARDNGADHGTRRTQAIFNLYSRHYE